MLRFPYAVPFLRVGSLNRADVVGADGAVDPAVFRKKGVNMEDMLDEITEHALDGKKVEERNEFQQACDDFVKAEKRFCKLNLSVRLDTSANADGWFAALKQRYVTEERVWELFCSGFETVQMTRLYLSFRDHLLRGDSLKPNA